MFHYFLSFLDVKFAIKVQAPFPASRSSLSKSSQSSGEALAHAEDLGTGEVRAGQASI